MLQHLGDDFGIGLNLIWFVGHSCHPGVQSLGCQAELHSESLSLLKSFKCRQAQRPEEVSDPLELELQVFGWNLSSGSLHALTTEPSLTLHKIVYVYRRLRDERPSGSKTHDAYIKILSKPMVGKVKYYKNREQCVLISLRFLRRKEVEVFASLARSSS